ncbi:MAG: pseudaminic acid synthase [Halobacteriovoraceae bacterium]|nr:pseudaminic acid synthase [Halobacteriovoraceae bacterium]
MKELVIDGVKIGAGYKPYIIAEISANHNGDINKALRLIEIAKESGANAVKLQTYTADTMTIKSDREEFKIKGGLWDGHTLYDLYEWAHTPWEWHKKLFDKAKEVGISIFSTPFDESAVDFLMELKTPAFKIASFEATDIPLIEYIAKQGKPIIISTGMANIEEIEQAVNTIKKYNDQLVVLHCVSSYPTPPEEMNLRTIVDISERFNVISGLSDHTLGTTTAVVGVSLGASVIEKHFIESREDKGPDSAFSLEPYELKKLVKETSTAFSSLGCANYDRKSSEKENIVFRRSIYFTKDLKKGDEITKENIRRIRPGFGIAPKFYNEILGQVVNKDISKGTPVHWDDINGTK